MPFVFKILNGAKGEIITISGNEGNELLTFLTADLDDISAECMLNQ